MEQENMNFRVLVLQVATAMYVGLALLSFSSWTDALVALPALLFPLYYFVANRTPFTLVMLCFTENEEAAHQVKDMVTADFDVLIICDADDLTEPSDPTV